MTTQSDSSESASHGLAVLSSIAALVDDDKPTSLSSESHPVSHSPKSIKNPPQQHLSSLTRRFLSLLRRAPKATVAVQAACERLRVPKRRLYDITNVLEGIGVLEKTAQHRVRWKETGPIRLGPSSRLEETNHVMNHDHHTVSCESSPLVHAMPTAAAAAAVPCTPMKNAGFSSDSGRDNGFSSPVAHQVPLVNNDDDYLVDSETEQAEILDKLTQKEADLDRALSKTQQQLDALYSSVDSAPFLTSADLALLWPHLNASTAGLIDDDVQMLAIQGHENTQLSVNMDNPLQILVQQKTTTPPVNAPIEAYLLTPQTNEIDAQGYPSDPTPVTDRQRAWQCHNVQLDRIELWQSNEIYDSCLLESENISPFEN